LGREVEKSALDAAVLDVSFFFEDVEDGADGGVTRRAWQVGLDVGSGSFAEAVEGIHDLAFAPAERGRGIGIHMQLLQHECDEDQGEKDANGGFEWGAVGKNEESQAIRLTPSP
jgi:GNAT superfamily N-acetyltransferase